MVDVTVAEHEALIDAVQAGTEREWVEDRLTAERDALLAKFEALADEWEREEAYGCQDASICIRCTTFQRVIIRIRAVIKEARA